MNPRIRNKIEAFFSNLADIFYRHCLKSLFSCILVIVALTRLIPSTVIDTSAVAILRENDPTRIQYNAFREQFDENEIIIITVTPDAVFNIPFLERLRAFHNDLENHVPYIKEITSLINARYTHGKDDALMVEALLEFWPETRSDLEALKKRVFANPLYLNTLISKDGKVITLLLETEAVIENKVKDNDILTGFEDDKISGETEPPILEKPALPRYFSDKENRHVVEAVNRIIKEYESPDFLVSLAGDPVVLDVYNRAMETDIVKVILLSIITIAIFLTLLFRRVSGVLLPEIVIISGLLSTAGLISLFNVTIKLTTIVLPGFLLAVSVGYSVHILAIFFVQYQNGRTKKDAITYAVGHSGFAVVLTALTTAASLFSFAFAELTAISDLGFFGAAGVLLALVYTMVLLPACIALFPIRRKPKLREDKKTAVMDKVLLSFSNLSTRHPKKIVAGTFVLFAVSIFYTFQVVYSHNVLNWIAQKEKIQTDVRYIDTHMQGSVILEVILDTRKDNGIKNPLFLKRIEAFKQDVQTFSNEHLFVGKVIAINDIIKEIHKALFDNDPAYYIIPEKQNVVSQELLLFENSGSDDLERFTDLSYRLTRISIKTPWTDAVHLKNFITHVETLLEKRFPDIESKIITGIPALMSRTIPAALRSMAKSYLIAFMIITGLMIAHVGSVKIGLLSMVSNLLPIFMIMGIMGAFKIKLDMSTIMIGSIAIGIVVDDTLHFMYNFRKYYDATGNPAIAIEKTMLGTGRALLLTSVILSSGFFILMTASLPLLIMFGFLTGLTIIFALLADFIVNPALMILVTDHKTDVAVPANHC